MTKYGPEMTQEVCKHLSVGMGRVDSCTLAGISFETFCQWMKRTEFSDAVKKAETVCKERNLAIIQRAASKTWQAAAWTLERKYPMEFGLKVAHNNPDGTPLNLHAAAVLLIQHVKGANDGNALSEPTSIETSTDTTASTSTRAA